jgi:hypothetical protein
MKRNFIGLMWIDTAPFTVILGENIHASESTEKEKDVKWSASQS